MNVVAVVIIVVIILVLIAGVLVSYKMKGGYGHKILLTKGSLRVLNKFLKAIGSETLDSRRMDLTATVYSNEFRRDPGDKIIIGIKNEKLNNTIDRPFSGPNGYQIVNNQLNRISLSNLSPERYEEIDDENHNLYLWHLTRPLIVAFDKEFHHRHTLGATTDKSSNLAAKVLYMAQSKHIDKFSDVIKIAINVMTTSTKYDVPDGSNYNNGPLDFDDFDDFDTYKWMSRDIRKDVDDVKDLDAVSFTVDFINSSERYDYRHSITVYRGIVPERDTFGNDDMDNWKDYPLKSLFMGFDVSSFKKGESGFGMYATPSLSVATAYGDVVLVYTCKYNRYWPSILNFDMPDSVLEAITHGFDPKYLVYPSDEIIDLWLLEMYDNEKDVAEIYCQIKYNTTADNIVPSIRKKMICKIPELAPVIQPKVMLLKNRLFNLQSRDELNKAGEFYESHNIDLIAAYTHGSRLTEYDHYKFELIYPALFAHMPAYEIAIRHGYGLKLRDVLLFR